MNEIYNAGYKNPPARTRFKKGCSGNPKGRPKGTGKKDVFDLMNKELASTVVLVDGSKLSKKEAIIKQLVNKGVAGDLKASKILMALLHEQQVEAISVAFLDRLIKEKFVGKENAKDYAEYRKSLDFNGYPKAINEIQARVTSSRSTSWHNVYWLEGLSTIGTLIPIQIIMQDIQTKMQEGIFFWDGVEKTLDLQKITGSERDKIIKSLEEKERVIRPSEELYEKCYNINFWIFIRIIVDFNVLIRHATSGYDFNRQKTLYFGNEHKKEVLKVAKEKLKNDQYKNVEDIINGLENGYELFINNPLYNLTSDRLSSFMKIPLAYEDIAEVFAWYNATQNEPKPD